jgi:hypothetical protein
VGGVGLWTSAAHAQTNERVLYTIRLIQQPFQKSTSHCDVPCHPSIRSLVSVEFEAEVCNRVRVEVENKMPHVPICSAWSEATH